jgi:NhaP-type Na+/H+ or K+/H+ antiporter
MSSDQVFIGVGLTLVLAVASQILGARLRIPALIILLPVGFIAGAITDDINPNNLLGATFQPLVSLSVAVILYDAGLNLDLSKLTGHTRTVVTRLLVLGVPLTWAIATVMAAPLFGMSQRTALMFGAILVVSGPTVVGPLLNFVRPTDRIRRILNWEGSLIDPVGGLLGAVVFHGVTSSDGGRFLGQVGQFVSSVAIGSAGGLVGVALLWLVLTKLRLSEALGTAAQLACVVGVAAVCDLIREDTGLIAAIMMGLAVANHRVFDMPARQPFFEVLVQLIIGVLFISISATVTAQSLKHLLLPTLGLVGALVLVARPLAAWLSTLGTTLNRGERAFVGWMDPRGIVAAATASTFAPSLVSKGFAGAEKVLPATFLVIVMTVTLYGLTAEPVARKLGVVRPSISRPFLIGGDPWVLDLARALKSIGLSVLMWAEVQTQRDRIAAAEIEVASDELIADATGEGAEIEGVTTTLFLTRQPGFNALAAALLEGGEVGRVYRLGTAADSDGSTSPFAGGAVLFGPELNGDEVIRRYRDGARIVVGNADAEPRSNDLLLFRVGADGELRPVVTGQQLEARPGDRTVSLGPVP